MSVDNSDSRLYSLDLLRGLDMIFLTVVAPLLWAVHAVWGLPGWLTWQLDHPWEGFTCWDIIMPLFIFMCGAAIPLSLERRLERNGGRPDGAWWRHVLWRVVMLWALGLLGQGRLATLDWDYTRLYDNTLQTIACGYLVVALTLLIPNAKVRLAIPVACFVLYGLLLHFLGDYSLNDNGCGIISVYNSLTSVGERASMADIADVFSRERINVNGLKKRGKYGANPFSLRRGIKAFGFECNKVPLDELGQDGLYIIGYFNPGKTFFATAHFIAVKTADGVSTAYNYSRDNRAVTVDAEEFRRGFIRGYRLVKK